MTSSRKEILTENCEVAGESSLNNMKVSSSEKAMECSTR